MVAVAPGRRWTAGPERLDKVVAALESMPRGEARRLIEAGGVWVDGRRIVRQSESVAEGSEVRVVHDALRHAQAARVAQEAGRGPVVLLDGPVAVLWKPPGMPVEPTRDARAGTLLAWVQDEIGAKRAAFHQRLDREAQGVLPVVLDPRWNARYAEALRGGAVGRLYRALLEGPVRDGSWCHRTAEGRTAITPAELPADRAAIDPDVMLSDVKSLGERDSASLVEVRLRTGRTHQIRVQARAEGAPVRGDLRYGRGHPGGLHLVSFRCWWRSVRVEVPVALLPPWARAESAEGQSDLGI